MHYRLWANFGGSGINRVKLNWFYLCALLAVGIFYSWGSFAAPAVFFVAASLVACLLLIWRVEDPVLRYVLLAALALRVMLALVQAYTGVDLPGAGADSSTFEEDGWDNTQAWLYGGEGGRTTGAYFFSSWIGILYIFFGRVEFIPQLFNIYFSLLAIYFLYCTIDCVFQNRQVSRIGVIVFALLPTINGFSAILLREIIIILFLILSFYYLVRWIKQGKFVLMFFSFLALAGAGALHGPMFLVLWVHLLLLCFYNPAEGRFRVVWWQFAAAIGVLVLAFLLIGEVITYQLPENLAEIITPDHMRKVVERKQIGRTSYLQEMVPFTYFDLAWQTPIRALYFLFAPFPWLIRAVQDVVGFFDVLIYLALFYYAFRGIKAVWTKNKPVVIAAVLIVASLVVMFSWGTTNYGTAWRHRQKVASYLVVMAAAGIVASPRLQLLWPENEE